VAGRDRARGVAKRGGAVADRGAAGAKRILLRAPVAASLRPVPPLNAGCRALDLADPASAARLPAWVLYPSLAPERRERFGPYALEVAQGAAPEGEALPLVLISHGNNGSPWTHRLTAAHLARAGFAVGLVEHLGNSRSDQRLTGTAAVLEARPRQLRALCDALFADPLLGPRLSGKAAVIGHSIGACTALSLAGGRPRCFAHESEDGLPRELSVERDPRVCALVLLAPAAGWFLQPGSLSAVEAPVLMLSGERDAIAPPVVHAAAVLRGLPDPARVRHESVAGAGHFSFQSPFPEAMVSAEFAPSQDPEGFDRAGHQGALNAGIERFLRDALA
jgi:predicted dienelactone hydrolase